MCLKGHLSTSCKCTHKTGRIKVKSMWYCNYLLLYMSTMALCTQCLLKYLCLTNLGNSQMKFCLSLEFSHCYGLYLCLCLVNAFEIILIQVQDCTRGEDMVQTCNKIMNKALENSKDCFFPPYTVLFFVLSFSYL